MQKANSGKHLFDLIKSIRRIPKVHCLHKTTLWVRHGINNKPHIYWLIDSFYSFICIDPEKPHWESGKFSIHVYLHTYNPFSWCFMTKQGEKCIVGELCRTEKKLLFSTSLMSNSNRKSCGVYKLLCWKNRREMTNRKKMRNFLTIWYRRFRLLGLLIDEIVWWSLNPYRRIQCLTIKSFNL